MGISLVKKLLPSSSLLLLVLAFFIQSAAAQVQTRSILYLNNGSVIKCNLIRIIPDSLIIVQTSDNNQWGYTYHQVDSLAVSRVDSSSALSEKNIVPQSSRSSAAGFFLGIGSSIGKDASSSIDGFIVGLQIGSGKNPGFLAQIGCLSAGSSGPSPDRVIFYSTLGLRIKTNLVPLGLFITPSFGIIEHDETCPAMGLAIDVYVIPKVFLGTKFLTSAGSLSSKHGSTISSFSFISFVIGYGVN